MEPIVEPVVFTEDTFDVHFHCSRKHDIEETVELYTRIMKLIGLKKFMILCAAFHSPTKFNYDTNLKSAVVKKLMSPNVYVSASFKHNVDNSVEVEADSLLRQAEEFYKVGFDGMKMLEAHPTISKYLGAMSGKRFEKAFAFLEENNIPILMHVADPRKSWDKSKCTPWELEHNRFYDDTMFSFDECIDDIMVLMKKFPKLNLCLAHGGFLWEDTEKPIFEKFLGDYENTSVDLAGGPGMYFAQDSDFFIPFITKYQDKFIYGSDTYNSAPYDYANWEYDIQYRPRCARNSFMGDQKNYDYAGNKYDGMNLPKSVCRKVFWENANKKWGETPRKTDENWLLTELDWCEKFYADNEFKSADLKKMRKILEK